jgi:hypothetical protein
LAPLARDTAICFSVFSVGMVVEFIRLLVWKLAWWEWGFRGGFLESAHNGGDSGGRLLSITFRVPAEPAVAGMKKGVIEDIGRPGEDRR